MKLKHNKRFKRDSQRVAFSLCVGFCGYGVMRKLGNGVGCPLTGRYASSRKVSGLWFLFVPSAFQFGVFRQVGFSGRCFPDINSLALEIQRIASINFWASARLGQLAHLEIRF
ncbi:hypothetical protein ACSTD9_22120 [Vibrio vulnificus]|uniref:hypothetical protein n=1 Tax=Vibrio vulnificus TaxID=672 RepID=UPI003EDB085C